MNYSILKILKAKKSIAFLCFAFFCFCIHCSSKNESKDENNDTSYLNFDLVLYDSIKIRKLTKHDNLNIINISNNRLVYYSADSNCLVVSNLVSNDLIKIDFLPESQQNEEIWKPFMVNYNYLNDSTIVICYESRWPFVDRKIAMINILSGKVTYPYIITHPDFVTKTKVPNEDLNVALRSFRTWFTVRYYSFPINKIDSSIYLTILTGDIQNKFHDTIRSRKNNLIALKANKINTDKYYSSFNLLSAVFKDSINQSDEMYSFITPLISNYSDSSFLISYEGSQKVYIYNFITKNAKILEPEINFIVFKNQLISHSVKKKSEIFSFGGFISHDYNKLLIRGIKFPSGKEESVDNQISRFLLYDNNLNCVGISSKDYRNLKIKSADKNYFYGSDEKLSNINDSWFIVYRYKIQNIIKKKGMFQFNESDQSAIFNKQVQLKNYVSDISNELLKSDTIPIVYTYEVCPSCIVKSGLFIQELQKHNFTHKKLILISNNVKTQHKFLIKYGLNHNDNIFLDTNGIFNTLIQNYSMGLLVRSSFGYKYIPIGFEEMAGFLKIISPKVRLIGNICVPVSD